MISVRALLACCALVLSLSATSVYAQTDDGAIYVVTYFEVQERAGGQAIDLMRRYSEASRKEAGNWGMTMAQEFGRPNRLAVIETWKDQPSFDAHVKAVSSSELQKGFIPIAISPIDQRVHHGFDVGPGIKLIRKDAVIAVSHIDVNPPNRTETEGLLTQLAEETRMDASNQSFEVYQQIGRLNHFGIVGIWSNRKSFEAYERAAHTRRLRESLQPLLGALYDERLYRPLIEKRME